MAKNSKRFKELLKKVDTEKNYSIDEAISTLKTLASAKFDETIELALKLNVDPRHAEQMVRGSVVLPAGTGKTVRVAVVANDAKADEAKNAGADIVGSDELIEDIQNGSINFDVLIATPNLMGLIGKVGRILGPKGLMPNPKTGTVTVDVAKAVKEVKAGRAEYRTDSFGNVHGIIGRVSFSAEDLIENLDAFMAQLLKVKPSTVKGEYVKNITICSTMGPGIKVENNFDK